MSWKKFLVKCPLAGASDGTYSVMGGATSWQPVAKTNYSQYLPMCTAVHPNRIERYGQYNVMDMDSEVNAPPDILAEFAHRTTHRTTSVQSYTNKKQQTQKYRS